jgi:hypothetical protein
MAVPIMVLSAVTLVTLIPVCWYRSVSYDKLHGFEETGGWRFVAWTTLGLMMLGMSIYMGNFFLLRRSIEFAGASLLLWVLGLYCVFLWASLIHHLAQE